jgi:hypothetical protein
MKWGGNGGDNFDVKIKLNQNNCYKDLKDEIVVLCAYLYRHAKMYTNHLDRIQRQQPLKHTQLLPPVYLQGLLV